MQRLCFSRLLSLIVVSGEDEVMCYEAYITIIMTKQKAVGTKSNIGLSAEEYLKEVDPKTASLVAHPKTPTKTLTNVYIGGMDTLSWSQSCHSGNFCSDETWVDTETTLFLYEDEECQKSAGLVAIYNGKRVGDNSSLLATAIAAYLAKAPVSLHYTESNEPYARSHGRLRAVMRLWFHRCTPCCCEED
jgi:hypothetical protein